MYDLYCNSVKFRSIVLARTAFLWQIIDDQLWTSIPSRLLLGFQSIRWTSSHDVHNSITSLTWRYSCNVSIKYFRLGINFELFPHTYPISATCTWGKCFSVITKIDDHWSGTISWFENWDSWKVESSCDHVTPESGPTWLQSCPGMSTTR